MSLIPKKVLCMWWTTTRPFATPAMAAGGGDFRVRCFDSAESFLSRYDPAKSPA